MADAQSFKDHARFIPLYHVVTFGIFVVNLGWQGWRLLRDGFTGDRLMLLLVAVALILLFFFARIFALTVQDRVIRNEMLARLAAVLPPPLASRTPELTLDQLIALRFASDAEMAALVERVLADGIRDRKAIKSMIRSWRPDTLRA
jgi:hypothetical protein